MSLPTVLSPEAEADMEDAVVWHERQSAGLGVDLVREVRNTLVRIGDYPEAYPELRSGIRRAQVQRFSYGVFYRVRADRVEVFGIFHDRRSPRIWQRRVHGA